MKKKKFNDWFWDYTYQNWKLTPRSKGIISAAAFIVIAGAVTAYHLNKKK